MRQLPEHPLFFPFVGIFLTCCILWIVTLGHSDAQMLNAVLVATGSFLLWSAALAIRLRDPGRPLNRLMFALASIYAMQVFVTTTNPALYTFGRATRPLVEAMLLWVMLAFPTGRLGSGPARIIVAIAMVVLPLVWLLGLTTSSSIPFAGRFADCGAACPQNLLLIVEHPFVAGAAFGTMRVVGIAVEVAAALLLAYRLLRAKPLMRKMLAPVLFASIVRMLSITAFLISGYGGLALTLTFWLVPTAIVLGQLRGQLYMAHALQQLVSGLTGQPEAGQLRQMMADALGDPTLEVIFWSQDRACWVNAMGEPVDMSTLDADTGRAVTIVHNAKKETVAALVHDPVICDEPAFPQAMTHSMRVALESLRTRAELARSQHEVVYAADSARERIERDLHDGAQQRLIALRLKISVAQRLMDHDRARARSLLAELDGDVAAALDELRILAHGASPPILDRHGLSTAVRDLAERAPLPVRTQIEEVGRWDTEVEQAVYFCCAEALQNAAKHAGRGSTAWLSMSLKENRILVHIEDDGAGLQKTDGSQEGRGLANLRARMEACGGTVAFGQGARGGLAMTLTIPTNSG